MKNLLLTLVAAIASISLSAQTVDISVSLDAEGNADIKEVWTVTADRGTEMYLVRTNLDDIEILDFRVTDESGAEYDFVDKWDTDRSLPQKAGKCGIIHRKDGVELCWGLGSYGNHRFTASYKMTNAVKSMDDYDALHLQLVSPGTQPRPQSVTAHISAVSSLNESNSAIWSFGYEGTINYDTGGILAKTDSPFLSDDYSMIVLIRFDKGIFHPLTSEAGNFQQKLDIAFRGSAYEDYLQQEKEEEKMFYGVMILSILVFGFAILAIRRATRKENLRMFGMERVKDIGYEREIPFGGNLFATRYILAKCGRFRNEGDLAGALILQMVKKKYIILVKNADGDVELAFNPDTDMNSMNPSEKEFYEMLLEAGGNDRILQKREFPRYSRRHQKKVSDWVKGLEAQGKGDILSCGMLKGAEFTPEGQLNARRAIGFKNYLNDFTLISERSSSELGLWQDYLIFGSLYGIADKIAKELKEIDPKLIEESFGYDYMTLHRILFLTNNMSSSVMGAVARTQTSASVAGGGGFSSFGGGGGFHGGGFGGGIR